MIQFRWRNIILIFSFSSCFFNSMNALVLLPLKLNLKHVMPCFGGRKRKPDIVLPRLKVGPRCVGWRKEEESRTKVETPWSQGLRGINHIPFLESHSNVSNDLFVLLGCQPCHVFFLIGQLSLLYFAFTCRMKRQ